MNPSDHPRFFTVHDAAAYVSLSRRTLDYARCHGELPFIRKGRKVLIDRLDLDAWVLRDRIDVTDAVRALTASPGGDS